MKLGANLEEVTKGVKKEVLSQSEVSSTLPRKAHSSSKISTKRSLTGLRILKLSESTNRSCFVMPGRHYVYPLLKKKTGKGIKSGVLLMAWLSLISPKNLHGPFASIGKTLNT